MWPATMDIAEQRASIDRTRIGIGGVSHGSFIPIFMIQQADRITAWSGANSWGQNEYYFGQPLPEPFGEPAPSIWPEDPNMWRDIDIADHLDTIEAPLLFQVASQEMMVTGRVLRRLSDARLPYDAYIFANELHQKWQPAHRLAIYNRNLDWFRFWLQDIEDPDPEKAEQYDRWRQLRGLQCANRRSLRDYCNVVSVQAPPA